jgi:hypothetical protein
LPRRGRKNIKGKPLCHFTGYIHALKTCFSNYNTCQFTFGYFTDACIDVTADGFYFKVRAEILDFCQPAEATSTNYGAFRQIYQRNFAFRYEYIAG